MLDGTALSALRLSLGVGSPSLLLALGSLALLLSLSATGRAESSSTQPATQPAGPSVGWPAPPFTLADQDDKPVKLTDFRGQWVVLYFYPKDDTPGCTTEACEFTEGLEAFANLKAKVLGVSADSPESHRRFIAKHQLKLTLLSDPDRKVQQRYGAWVVEDGKGRMIRSTVLINPEGVIAHHWPKVAPRGHADEVRKKIEELRK